MGRASITGGRLRRAPGSRLSSKAPGVGWSGDGYHDMNWGDVALEGSFIDWTWSRAALKQGAGVIYDTLRRDGTRKSFALRFDEQGRATSHPCRRPMPCRDASGGWGARPAPIQRRS